MGNQKYHALVKTVELGSLTKAAQVLGYTQSGISHMIQALEEEVGMRLLLRGRSGVRLTTEGEQLFPYFKEIYHSERRLDNRIREMLTLDSGLLRIGAFTSVSVQWLPYIIKAFLRDFPKIEFEIIYGEYAEIEKWIMDGSVDCGFLRLPTKQKLYTRFLRRDELVVILPKGHPLCDCAAIDPQSLEKYPFALLDEEEDYEVASVLTHFHIYPKIKFTVKDDHTIIAMVANGLCISIMPQLVLRNTPYQVVQKSISEPVYRELGIAVKDIGRISGAAARFMEYTEKWVSSGAEA